MRTKPDAVLKCECGKKIKVYPDGWDKYNIFWVTSDKHSGYPYMPKILCPECTQKWSKNS